MGKKCFLFFLLSGINVQGEERKQKASEGEACSSRSVFKNFYFEIILNCEE